MVGSHLEGGEHLVEHLAVLGGHADVDLEFGRAVAEAANDRAELDRGGRQRHPGAGRVRQSRGVQGGLSEGVGVHGSLRVSSRTRTLNTTGEPNVEGAAATDISTGSRAVSHAGRL